MICMIRDPVILVFLFRMRSALCIYHDVTVDYVIDSGVFHAYMIGMLPYMYVWNVSFHRKCPLSFPSGHPIYIYPLLFDE